MISKNEMTVYQRDKKFKIGDLIEFSTKDSYWAKTLAIITDVLPENCDLMCIHVYKDSNKHIRDRENNKPWIFTHYMTDFRIKKIGSYKSHPEYYL